LDISGGQYLPFQIADGNSIKAEAGEEIQYLKVNHSSEELNGIHVHRVHYMGGATPKSRGGGGRDRGANPTFMIC
jgi:hypothetical protein